MTPEAKARIEIDTRLTNASWVVQDFKQLNLGAALGVAVREYPTDKDNTSMRRSTNSSVGGPLSPISTELR